MYKGVGGVGVRWVVAKAKSKKQEDTMVEFRVTMMFTCTHKGPRPRQTCADIGSNVRSPLPNWSPSFLPFHQSWMYNVRKKHSGEAHQLTLASESSEHA